METRRTARMLFESAAEHDRGRPESIIHRMAELDDFGVSVPVEYGGQGMGNLVMIVIAEERSAASPAAAGSLHESRVARQMFGTLATGLQALGLPMQELHGLRRGPAPNLTMGI